MLLEPDFKSKLVFHVMIYVESINFYRYYS